MAPQEKDTAAKENIGPAQYRRATLRRLCNVLAHARSKLSAAQSRYKTDFGRKVSFRSVTNAGDFVYFDRPPHESTKAEMQNPVHLNGNITNSSRKLLPKSEASYCVRMAIDTVVHSVWDAVTTSVSIDRIREVSSRRRAVRSFAATGGKDESEAVVIEAATSVCTTVQDSRRIESVGEDEDKFVIEKLTGHNRTDISMQYRVL